jgi:hypothetical protein
MSFEPVTLYVAGTFLTSSVVQLQRSGRRCTHMSREQSILLQLEPALAYLVVRNQLWRLPGRKKPALAPTWSKEASSGAYLVVRSQLCSVDERIAHDVGPHALP